jgi:hypothetical protein
MARATALALHCRGTGKARPRRDYAEVVAIKAWNVGDRAHELGISSTSGVTAVETALG